MSSIRDTDLFKSLEGVKVSDQFEALRRFAECLPKSHKSEYITLPLQPNSLPLRNGGRVKSYNLVCK
jgi:hypothetical protein